LKEIIIEIDEDILIQRYSDEDLNSFLLNILQDIDVENIEECEKFLSNRNDDVLLFGNEFLCG